MAFRNVEEIIVKLKSAQQNLQELREKFAGDKFLLGVYEPSAVELVNLYKGALEEKLSREIGENFSIEREQDMDFWIHIEGKNFKNGQGPISFVSSYLNKLNSACRETIRILGGAEYFDREESLFCLAETAAGSLRLGIRKNTTENDNSTNEHCLFSDTEINWEEFNRVAQKNEHISRAINLLLKIMESSNSEEKLGNLMSEIGDADKFVKLLNYARELMPSNKSGVISISFERFKGNRVVSVDVGTRSRVNEYTKKILPDKRFVFGIAAIRSQDLDTRKIIARPFYNKELFIDELDCAVPSECSMENYLNNIVFLTGVLVSDRNKRQRLEIDTIRVFSQDDE